MRPKIGVLVGIDADDLKRIVLRPGDLAEDDVVSCSTPGACDSIAWSVSRSNRIVGDDLQNQLGAASEIQSQLDVLLQSCLARENPGKHDSPQTNERDGKNDKKRVAESFIHMFSLELLLVSGSLQRRDGVPGKLDFTFSAIRSWIRSSLNPTIVP